MPRDPRVDAYIASKADFARPILEHLREAVHAACPEVEETIKWSMPSFTCKGRILAHMAAFKAHAAFGFWQGKEVVGDTGAEGDAMGQFGRIASIESGVLPIINLASSPTALTRFTPFSVSTATTDGSFSTIPRPRT